MAEQQTDRALPPDPEDKNDDRADWAEASLGRFQEATGADREDALSDLLCDMMHWCDRNDTDFAHELSRAIDHYGAETDDEGKQHRRISISS